ncbi:uncharacterized protein A4U43_C01F2060 [Asparagus officinalis]|uniref:Sphingomyelin synthase-like domain-containing protein n=1 Tax=Asparagus officinalis TaxID=4686 RepID=A0A5P1FQN4_ASPOF|nr:uncharacterized protein A4U43_C01F2060 [Asparagus officinalis]
MRGSELATLPPPDSVWEVLLINFPRGVIYGCGDLIFSSHMIFTLVFVRVYHKYGSKRCIKALAWLMAIIQSLLIIASRKHYSVDVVVAWACVQRWCNEKGDIMCEICHEPYKPDYTAPPRPNPDETTIDISGVWTIIGTPLELCDPRILAMAAE